MGYDKSRFVNPDEVPQDVLCPFCKQVAKFAQESKKWPCSGHLFCEECLHKRNLFGLTKCPRDGKKIKHHHLVPASLDRREKIAHLMIKCGFDGCHSVVPLFKLQQHEKYCLKNPEGRVKCDNLCGLVLSRSEYNDHDCYDQLRDLAILQQELNAKRKELSELQEKETEQAKKPTFDTVEKAAFNRQLEFVKGKIKDLQDKVDKRTKYDMEEPREVELASDAGSVNQEEVNHEVYRKEWIGKHTF